MPVLDEITATGLLRTGDDSSGRETQSSAFFRTPGMDALYSGVAMSTPSASANARFRRCTAGG